MGLIQLNLFAVVLLFAFVQGTIYTVLLLVRAYREARLSDYFLAGIIMAACVHNLSWMLGFMGIHILGQEWWFLPQDVGFIFGPLVYYYLKTQINTDYTLRRRDRWHFMPYVLYATIHLLVFFMGDAAVQWWAEHMYGYFHTHIWMEMLPSNVSVLVYLGVSARLYARYRKWLPTERSDAEDLQFRWFRNFLIVMFVLAGTAVAFFTATIWFDLTYQEIWTQRALVAVGIYYTCITGYAQSQPRQLVFNVDSPEAAPAIVGQTDAEKEPLSPEKRRELEDWKGKIETVMQQQRLYLQPDLSLQQLAVALDTHATHLSGIINSAFGKNFNDYVNTFRVNTFQQKAHDPALRHLTLLAIAFECGFNSKSTFNRAVKRITGLQPSDLFRQSKPA